jgi:enoyl-[acyl-carrier protein] reductase II
LVPAVCNAVKIPVIAAGGLATGRQMLAAMVLGAEGVQMGSRFVASTESSSHPSFKDMVIHSREGDTILTMKQLVPVRILKNKFYEDVFRAEQLGADKHQMLELLGKGRSRRGMFEGDLENGELEIGQVSALLEKVEPAAEIVRILWKEFSEALTLPLRTE